MRVTIIFSVVALTALANGATILDAVKAIQSDVKQVQETALKWTGDLAGFEIVLAEALCLMGATCNGAKTADESAPLSYVDADEMATATTDLMWQVANMTRDIGRMQVKVQNLDAHIDATHRVLVNLQDNRNTTAYFGSKVVAKVPATERFQYVRGAIMNNMYYIDVYYGDAIKCYDGTRKC